LNFQPSEMVVDPDVLMPVIRDGEGWVVGAVVLDDAGRAFVQRRSPQRRLFPGCWDVVGGRVEPGETILAALQREMREETGWELHRVHACLGKCVWKAEDGRTRQEVDYLIEVVGDLTRPKLESAKHDAFAWITVADLPRLMENRTPDDTFIRDIVARALRVVKGTDG